MSNWAPIPSPANHGVDRQFDKLLKDRHNSKLIERQDQTKSLKVPPLNMGYQLQINSSKISNTNIMDDTSNSKRHERAQELVNQFGDDVGSSDDDDN